MDNAGSTNKNKYLMAAVYDVVRQKVLDFFQVSFMVAGHTKFAPGRPSVYTDSLIILLVRHLQ